MNTVNGELTTPYCGYEPCPWTTPNLTPATYATINALGTLGSYPPVACRTIFKSVDFNTGALTNLFLRSASCPGYSYGQVLNTAAVGETLTWSYMGGSDALYLDADTLEYMFPGLGISLTVSGVNGGSPVNYTVTGVFAALGYVTVMDATHNSGGPLEGTGGTVYSCASSCTIGQAPYAWTAY